MATPAKCDTILQAMVLSSEALLDRHLDVLGRKPNPGQDYEVFELREVIADAKEALKAATNPHSNTGEGTMKKVWCVQHRDGWCATLNGKRFVEEEEGVNNVQTKCDHFITLPTGCEKRIPTCPGCREKLNPHPGRQTAGQKGE